MKDGNCIGKEWFIILKIYNKDCCNVIYIWIFNYCKWNKKKEFVEIVVVFKREVW